ncbi:MAG: NfeD family protein [Deltaproteobacteria bacterium]|nr:NfeD family protein [Deltaproteobacteria bacterium]
MDTFFSHYSAVETFFFICAVVGGFFVLMKFAMMFMGFDHDIAHDFDSGGHGIEAHHTDSDTGFHVLSLHGISSFLMMFGLVGLAMFRQSHFGAFLSLIGAVVAGCISVWIIGKLFFMFNKLKSSGTISIDSTVGAQGKVYMKIPEMGVGRVLINAKNSLREYDASTNDGKGIDTGTAIRVIWVDGNVLVVERV